MLTFTDQTKHTISLEKIPKRIISIVPSQSELLWDLGLREELIGITKFCIHPNEMFRKVERVGGTKKLDIEKIRELKPDLIIGNKEENEREQIELLRKEFQVWMSDIFNFEDALEMMKCIGDLTGKQSEAEKITEEINRFLPSIKVIFPNKKTAYFIWKDPYMLAASDTYIDAVLNHIGLSNAASGLSRYPEITIEQLKKIKPEYCFLSSEPFPFKEKHAKELQEFLPETKVIIVDGEMFSWYGSRLLHLPAYLKKLGEEIR
ncbi:MAG: iron transporter [Bacteroidetes bacterium]|jgi:ABC-type Fe3+-hydroxamate transport system substrate-binding protein|nr:iron transporter [Bacteroidota bacterium]